MSLSNHPNTLGGGLPGTTTSGGSPVGTLGITDDQVAVGATAPNTIEGSANFTFGLTNGLRLSSSVTSGAQLYNTADQTTNYERLEAVWSGNVALIRQVSTGSVSNRSLRLQAQITSGATSTIELDRNSLPFGEFTYSSNQANAGTSWLFTQTGQSTATTGSPIFFAITPSYNQASGTAANTDLLINRTETAVGSGAQLLIDAQVGGSSRFSVTNAGNVNVGSRLGVGTTAISGARLVIASAVSVAAWGTAGTRIQVQAATDTDATTAGSGTAATAVFSSFAQPTLAATNASVTTTDAATVYIANAPAAGTNQTITRPHALWIDAGSFRLDGTDGAGAGAGTLSNAPSAGDPDKWIPINSDGTQYWVPAWAL